MYLRWSYSFLALFTRSNSLSQGLRSGQVSWQPGVFHGRVQPLQGFSSLIPFSNLLILFLRENNNRTSLSIFANGYNILPHHRGRVFCNCNNTPPVQYAVHLPSMVWHQLSALHFPYSLSPFTCKIVKFRQIFVSL